ncbi:MAG: hypothetical protein ACSHXW_15790 [Yoonia sp.]
MTDNTTERMNYFQFQQVGAEDFRLEQLYHRDARARHDLGPHTWGVIQGAEIIETPREGDPGFVDIKVNPGLLVDGFGRRILLLEPVAVPPELFSVFNSERLLELWIHYDELPKRTEDDTRTTICIGDTAFSRVVETYRFIAGTLTPERDPIMVAGVAAKPPLADGTPDGDAPVLPPDTSLPAQDLPDPWAQGFWPIRLGSVRWDGTVGKFAPVLDPNDLTTGRVQAGFIGGSLLGEGGAMRIAPRFAHPDGPDHADFASIEGRLRVDGGVIAKEDIFVHGGMISWQSEGGSDETVPLTARRIPDEAGSGADLRFQIGDNDAAENARMTVGTGTDPFDADPDAVVVSVRADGMMDMPKGRFRAVGVSRQAIELGVDADPDPSPRGFGWQGSSVYARTGASYYWYKDGEHSAAQNDPGAGGEVLMHLSGLGALNFGQEFREVLNFNVSGQSSSIGVQDETLYFRSDRNFAWYRGGGHSDVALSGGGGARAMYLNNTSQLNIDGGLRTPGNVQLDDSRIAFRNSAGGDDGDPIEIYRHRRANEQHDLRMRIGNDNGGGDRFVVGSESGGFTELFRVDNRGDGYVDGDLEVNGRLTSEGQDVLVDVIAGEVFLNRTSGGTGTRNVVVNSTRLSSIGQAQIMVGLSDISNAGVANSARWRVQFTPGTETISGTTATFPIKWTVGDSDGALRRFSYVAILTR